VVEVRQAECLPHLAPQTSRVVAQALSPAFSTLGDFCHRVPSRQPLPASAFLNIDAADKFAIYSC
jgi:hypothetical protein